MPLTSSFSVQSSTTKVWPPLPDDVYQFELLDIEARKGTKYLSEELEDKLNFSFVCIDEGVYYGRRIWKEVTPKLVGGAKPSGLYQLLSGLTGKQYSKEECKKAQEIFTPTYLNSLIGTQVRLALKKVTNTVGREVNKIDSFLPAKEQKAKFDESKMIRDQPVPNF